MNYNESISDIQADLLGNMPDKYSKVKGTWLWEMTKAFSIELSEFLQLLSETSNKLNVDNLQGDELDAYVYQWTDLTRKTAQKAKGYIDVTGNGIIYSGTLVSNGNTQYEVISDMEINGFASVCIIAVEAGEIGNTDKNTVTEMVTSNTNIKSMNNPNPIEGGSDEETDEALRERYHIRLSMPATSGNRAHYILWALECDGVGGAKALRDKEIKNKVNVYICGNSGESADSSVVHIVQNYIDPNMNGDGSGTAPIGAICEVFSAGIKTVDISGNVEIDNTVDIDITLLNIKSGIQKYLSKINFQKNEVSYAKLLNVAVNSLGVSDITNFKVNGGYVNIVCEETEIFSLNKFSMEVE